jgi:hypothetical protein
MLVGASYRTASVPEENRQVVGGSYKYSPLYDIQILPKQILKEAS